jgi:hypothetical protein
MMKAVRVFSHSIQLEIWFLFLFSFACLKSYKRKRTWRMIRQGVMDDVRVGVSEFVF